MTIWLKYLVRKKVNPIKSPIANHQLQVISSYEINKFIYIDNFGHLRFPFLRYFLHRHIKSDSLTLIVSTKLVLYSLLFDRLTKQDPKVTLITQSKTKLKFHNLFILILTVKLIIVSCSFLTL